MDADISDSLQAAVRGAIETRQPLQPRGHGSKDFYGNAAGGERLDVSGHRGVVSYEPGDLVLSARAGTPLAQIEALLTEHGQMLGFEPPQFGGRGTLGGAVAAGWSGPRRPWAGSVRDFVLGVRAINGRGERVRFGGETIKNVAGYDLPRLYAGSLGTLGLLLEVSVRVLPIAEAEVTLVLEPADPLRQMLDWQRRPWPLSGLCQVGGQVYLRLSGTAAGVDAARKQIGGEPWAQGAVFWQALRDLELPFFAGGSPLWRMSVLPATPPPDLAGEWLVDWGGAQRWLRSEAPPAQVWAAAAAAHGHASLIRDGERGGGVFQPLPPAHTALQQRLKAELDPSGLFSPGRLYSGF
ncbi:glycolate oxidase subunit GlcE [Immundisolibacter sp.]|uniref:glycolate oxidase subunit GlcE n=2 Tax=Immundisolibacter sp. TaxID=1934948 RepID=UPI0035615594